MVMFLDLRTWIFDLLSRVESRGEPSAYVRRSLFLAAPDGLTLQSRVDQVIHGTHSPYFLESSLVTVVYRPRPSQLIGYLFQNSQTTGLVHSLLRRILFDQPW
jgi:hypothetical protein